MTQRLTQKISLALGAALAVLLVVAAIAILSMRRFVHDAEWVSHTHLVRAELSTLDSRIGDAKADVRGFLITGDSGFIRRYHADRDSAYAVYDRLKTLTADNPAQQDRLSALQELLTLRRMSFETTLALHDRLGTRPADVARQLDIGESLSARIGTELASVAEIERVLLVQRSAAQTRSERALAAVIAALALFAVVVALLVRRSIQRDLLGRARAEASLRASEAKFSGILEIAADAIITVDREQRVLHFNRSAEAIFGYTAQEISGRSLDLLLPQRFQVTHRAHVDAFGRAPEYGRQMSIHSRVFGRRRNGEEFPADISISKLETPEGTFFTAVLRDVTEQQRAERNEHLLAEAGARLAASLDVQTTLRTVAQLPVGPLGEWCLLDIVRESETGDRSLVRIASADESPDRNQALRALEAAGVDRDAPARSIDVLRTGAAEIVAEVTADWLEAHTATPDEMALFARLGARTLLVVPLRAGAEIVAAMTIGSSRPTPFDAADREVAVALAARAALAIENARLYRRAQRATAARDEVLGVVSHDLRNPLSAVAMSARALMDGPARDEAERRSVCQNILDSTDWMHRLLQDLLDAASIEAGRLSIEIEAQPIWPVIEATVEMFAARAASQGVALRTEAAPDLPKALIDGTRIMQVLANLVGNALKFTEAGGAITIAATARGGELLVSVRDTGVGIPPEHVPHLFERFWQDRRNSRTRGSGLGLAIARGIVQAHGGRIWVESMPGLGSTFQFTLPLAPVRALGGLGSARELQIAHGA